jgi:ABC-type bacteriocin/lantibiotic exporter with double-glycine peptidase domain
MRACCLFIVRQSLAQHIVSLGLLLLGPILVMWGGLHLVEFIAIVKLYSNVDK